MCETGPRDANAVRAGGLGQDGRWFWSVVSILVDHGTRTAPSLSCESLLSSHDVGCDVCTYTCR